MGQGEDFGKGEWDREMELRGNFGEGQRGDFGKGEWDRERVLGKDRERILGRENGTEGILGRGRGCTGGYFGIGGLFWDGAGDPHAAPGSPVPPVGCCCCCC